MPSLLILADVDCWAYAARARALRKYAPPAWRVDIGYTCHKNLHAALKNNPRHLAKYDVVFLLDYMSRWVVDEFKRGGAANVFVVSFNRDSRSRLEKWDDIYRYATDVPRGFMICNNREIFEHHGRAPRTCNISNGVDGEAWGVDAPMAGRPRKLVWCGGQNPKKGKGWQEVLEPLQKSLPPRGFDTHFRPYVDGPIRDWAWPQPRMRAWYNSAFAVLVASNSEGTPNIALEAMACGCVLVTTRVGNALEFGRDGENVVFADRSPRVFERAIEAAWSDRERLSAEGERTMRGWTYGDPGRRAAYFYALFDALLERGADKVRPFSYMECRPEEIGR